MPSGWRSGVSSSATPTSTRKPTRPCRSSSNWTSLRDGARRICKRSRPCLHFLGRLALKEMRGVVQMRLRRFRRRRGARPLPHGVSCNALTRFPLQLLIERSGDRAPPPHSLIHTTPSANVPTEAFQQEVLATLSKHEAEVKAMRSDVQQVHAKLDELFGLLRPKSNEVRRERSHRSQSRSPVGGERLTSVVKAAGQASRNGGTDGRPLSAPAQQGSQRNWETARRRMRTGEKVRKVGGQTAQRCAEYTANRLA
mmetsp:Transcript_37866/g.75927  ORF Transcript_37866/g.75927 Transcript_37866/m.75927 type:complete len:254 (-) Transcript_37866:79-840(-)